MSKESKMVRTSVTIPQEIHERLRVAADKEHRSVSKQILLLIEHYLEQSEGAK